ncbi:MAG: alcohol dehydrogenase catalytic domain-containing protein [Dehalococcoidales bacterium]
MKVAVYYSNSDIRLEERPLPAIKNGEMLVKMMASGICGTDVMEWYRRGKAPRVLGHEIAGEVVAAGKALQGFKIGDRVFVSHHVPCFSCHYCLSGRHSACEALHTGNYDPGGFAEFIRIPEPNVKYGTLLLPEGVSYDEATMIEPLGCAVAGQRRIGLRDGQSILVIGSGVSGLSHIQLAKLKDTRVIATDINDYRLNKALEFGADYAINAVDYSVDELKRVNQGQLAEVVIVCAGAEKAVSDALRSVDRRGTILFFAVPQKPIALPSVSFWRDEVAITFSYGAATADLEDALKLIESGRVDAKGMITHRVVLAAIEDGFRLVSEANKSLKVVVVPE